MLNPYDVLGIPHGSSIEEARAAYRRLAMKCHPDRGGSSARFQEIQAAWSVIESGKVLQAPKSNQAPKAPQRQTWATPEPAFKGYSEQFRDPIWKKANEEVLKESQRRKAAARAAAESILDDKPKQKPCQVPKASKVIVHKKDRTSAGSFIARTSLEQAYQGFICEIEINGQQHQIRVPPGAPNGLQFTAPIDDLKDVTILVVINESEFIFQSVASARAEVLMIDGQPHKVIRTKDLRMAVEVSARDARRSSSTIEIVDFLGESVKVPIGNHDGDRPFVVRVEGHGYVDWFPELKRCGDYRGDLYVTIVPTEKVEMSHLNKW